MQLILSTPDGRGMLIHPAMVYERNGGVFRNSFEDAKQPWSRYNRGTPVRNSSTGALRRKPKT
jgi:hypothetical protein